MSEQLDERDARSQELRKEAKELKHEAERRAAIAIALEDDVLTVSEAKAWLSLDNDPERMQSDLYPGDEYFHRATDWLGIK